MSDAPVSSNPMSYAAVHLLKLLGKNPDEQGYSDAVACELGRREIERLRAALETIAAQWSTVPGSTKLSDCMAVTARQALRYEAAPPAETKAALASFQSIPPNQLLDVHAICDERDRLRVDVNHLRELLAEAATELWRLPASSNALLKRIRNAIK